MNKQHYKISLGAVLVVLSVLFLHKGVAVMDLDFEFISESLDDWSIFGPYLVLGLITGFIGFNLFFSALSSLSNENL